MAARAMRVLSLALCVWCTVAESEENVPLDSDDDVAKLLKDFDSGFDNSVKGLYAGTVDKLQQSAADWASAPAVQDTDHMFDDVEQDSTLNSVETELDEESSETARLGEGKKRGHKHAAISAPSGNARRKGDYNYKAETAQVELGEGESVEEGSKSHLKTKAKAKKVPPMPKHPGWQSVAQYSHYELGDELAPADIQRLHAWMQRNTMPTNDLGEGMDVEYRDDDLEYGYKLKHWTEQFQRQQLADEKAAGEEAKQADARNKIDQAYYHVADYVKLVHHKQLSAKESQALENFVQQSGFTAKEEAERQLGEGVSTSTDEGSKLYRGGDIEFAYSGNWNSPSSRFESIQEYCTRKKLTMSQADQDKLAAWMKMNNMVSQHSRELGEDAGVRAGKAKKKSADELQKEYLKAARSAQWRVADLQYGLQLGKWKRIIL